MSPYFLVVVGNLDAVEDALGCGNLIGTHDHQHVFRSKNTVLRQNVQDGVAGKNVFVKSIRSGIVLLLASAQNEVNSKLLLVLPF